MALREMVLTSNLKAKTSANVTPRRQAENLSASMTVAGFFFCLNKPSPHPANPNTIPQTGSTLGTVRARVYRDNHFL